MKQKFGRGYGCGNPNEARRLLDVARDDLNHSYETSKEVIKYTSGDCYNELQSILHKTQILIKEVQSYKDSIEL